MTDPLPLAQALLRCRSITPADDGAMAVVAEAAAAQGFTIARLDFAGTPNLFARRGQGAPHFCFAGHTDVVPPGDGWNAPPFGAELRGETLVGRGACDMKGAIAAFLASVAHGAEQPGSISLLMTGDEEGPATNGTIRVLQWLATQGEMPDFCLVGEPTCRERLGDTVKIGRRGSLNARIVVQGIQGHVAYPHLAANPIHALAATLHDITTAELDAGTEWFAPSSLQVTSVDVGNQAANLIPARVELRLNIRFNVRQSAAGLEAWLRRAFDKAGMRVEIETSCNAEPFLTEPGPFTERLRGAVSRATGVAPSLDTGGGTSDARFIAPHCKVAEFGLVGTTMHRVDESVPVADLRALAGAYTEILREFAA